MAEYKALIVSTEADEMEELLDFAWGIIANAYSGDWDKASGQWKAAAEKWRDKWARMSVSPRMESVRKHDHDVDEI